jgi:hypothetical protein
MPLLVDPQTPERLEIGSSVYLLKPPSVMERARWRRAIVAAGGRRHGQIAPAGMPGGRRARADGG